MSDDTRGRCPNCAWAFWHARKLNLTPSERLVLFAIAERADEDLQCVPTQAMLAEDTGLSVRTLIPAIKSLAKRKDCIKVERRREGLRYALLRPAPKPMTWPDVPEPVTDREVQNLHIAAQAEKTPEYAEFAHPNGSEHAKSAHPVMQNLHIPLMKSPLKERKKESKEESLSLQTESAAPPGRVRAHAGEIVNPAGFDQFWAAYPRKDDKGHARIAFARAVKRGTCPEDILDGVRRYPFKTDPQFQPLPTTWLNGERWTSEVDNRDPALVAAGITDAEMREFNQRQQRERPTLALVAGGRS